MVETIDFLVGQFTDVLSQSSLVHGSDLLQHDHGGLHKPTPRLQMVVGGQIGFRPDLRGNRRHDGGGTVPVANIVLDNDHRAIAVLLGANPRAQVCVVQFSPEICVRNCFLYITRNILLVLWHSYSVVQNEMRFISCFLGQ